VIFDSDMDIKGTFVHITTPDCHQAGGWHAPVVPVAVPEDVRALILAEVGLRRDTDRTIVREALLELEGVDVSAEQVVTVFDEIGFCDCHAGCEGCFCSTDCEACKRGA
jgi:hypothetical protein